MKNSFFFISTDNPSLVERCSNLLTPKFKLKEFITSNVYCSSKLFYSDLREGVVKHSHLNSKCRHISFEFGTSICNNNLESIWFNQHELHSFVLIDAEKLTLYSDPLGVFTIYYYHKNGTIILSDNIFLIANILDSAFSIDALFDSVMFKKPFGRNTWFSNIFCLQPGETAKLYFRDNCFIITGGTKWEDFYNLEPKNCLKAYSSFFEEHALNSQNSNVLALSAGSDSRAVLAGLLANKIDFLSFSWGGDNYLETFKIKKLVEKYGLNWRLIYFNLLKEKYEQYTQEAIFLSNGLIPATHHYYFYSQLPSRSYVFEGYGGSEFVKGELSDGMLTPLLFYITVNNLPLNDILSTLFGTLPDSTIKSMINYYTQYDQYFNPINSRQGKSTFFEYIFKTLPSKIFGGFFGIAEAFDLLLFEPFFSPHILSSLFSNKMGVIINNSLSPDFPGPVKALKPQALILEHINPSIFNSLLDRKVKYSEWNKPAAVINLKRKIRILRENLLFQNYDVSAQVDYKNIKRITTHDLNFKALFPNIDFGKETDPFCFSTLFSSINNCRNTNAIKEYLNKFN